MRAPPKAGPSCGSKSPPARSSALRRRKNQTRKSGAAAGAGRLLADGEGCLQKIHGAVMILTYLYFIVSLNLRFKKKSPHFSLSFTTHTDGGPACYAGPPSVCGQDWPAAGQGRDRVRKAGKCGKSGWNSGKIPSEKRGKTWYTVKEM